MASPHLMPDPSDPNAWRTSDARRANRRRLAVFLGAFAVVSVVGLLWCFLRPAQFRATSRLQVTPAIAVLPSESPASAGGESSRPFLTEVQALTSRPLIEQVAGRLRSAGHDLSPLGVDPVLGLQATLTATPVAGTNVIEMAAVGPRPELPAALLNGISEAYREQVARNYADATSEATSLAVEETAKLEATVAEKRRELEAFRVRHNIVSPEREENSILAEMQGLATNTKDAHKRVAEAEGKLAALRAAATEGKGVLRARDDPTLANLEQRASQARETLRALQRQYTLEYLALDPQARNLRTGLAELEDQIKLQREVGTRNALTEAEGELASARAAEARLQGQIAEGRQKVGQFAARFGQYKSLNDELRELEKTYQAALQRKALLEATERARMPALQVLEPALLPAEPWRPLYWRDAALVLAGSLLFALAAMWLVELFNRSQPQPSVVVTQPVFAGALAPQLQHAMGLAQSRIEALTVNETPLLAQAPSLPRELTVDECTALLCAADDDTRRAMALMFSGLSPEEAIALRWQDVDPATGTLRIGGGGVVVARTVQLAAGARWLFERQAGDAGPAVLPGPSGGGATLASLSAQMLCAAHDAGLERVQDIGPATLRHGYIAYLVRQGARFADLTRWVGPLDADLLSAYSALAPAGIRLDGAAIRRDFPALDRFESARTPSAPPSPPVQSG
jgi:polysaccharide biosynthesis transport protein